MADADQDEEVTGQHVGLTEAVERERRHNAELIERVMTQQRELEARRRELSRRIERLRRQIRWLR